MPAVTEPPGLLMYSQMSLSSSSPSRNSIWAQMMLEMSSLTSVPRMMIRSFRSRLKISEVGLPMLLWATDMVGKVWLTGLEASGSPQNLRAACRSLLPDDAAPQDIGPDCGVGAR